MRSVGTEAAESIDWGNVRESGVSFDSFKSGPLDRGISGYQLDKRGLSIGTVNLIRRTACLI